MIIRIVKMTFREGQVGDFLEVFQEIKSRIAAFPGCTNLELLRDAGDKPVFFTYSYWNSPEDLEKYRQSELFQSTWRRTKALFDAKAEAWSLERMDV